MKKFLILSVMSVFTLPVFAVCPITEGACTAYSNWSPKPLQQQLLPDKVQEVQSPDAFRPRYFQPYNDALINTDSSSMSTPKTNDYNSNCQFGVCLPEVNGGEEIFE